MKTAERNQIKIFTLIWLRLTILFTPSLFYKLELAKLLTTDEIDIYH